MTDTLSSQTDVTAPSETTATAEASKFDDVMLAMDIVDTLRHRALVVERELAADDREDALIDRLREIYKAQGIEVPDHILKDGVKALEEKRFVYDPPKGGFQHSLAKLYIGRDRWLKPVAAIFGIAAFSTAIYEVGIDGPRERRAEAERIELQVTLPKSLAEERDAALEVAATDNARRRIETIYQDGVAAIEEGNAIGARQASVTLEAIEDDLSQDLTVRVISRPGEYSGIFRIPDDAPGQRNYYLIVEGIDAAGRPHALEISSEEDQSTKRVERWGIRVPEGEFNRISADKQDDQIIQNAVVGSKPVGHLLPTYSVPTAGGAILEW
ncbi:MAG: DUF6384 family protein [Pseudomonadota bacterium]